MEMTVYGRPIPKARPRITSRGGRTWGYTEDSTEVYAEDVSWSAKSTECEPIPKGIPVRVELTFTLRGKPTSKPDIINLASNILDALTGIVYYDDSQVTELVVLKGQGFEPKVHIKVEEINRGKGAG